MARPKRENPTPLMELMASSDVRQDFMDRNTKNFLKNIRLALPPDVQITPPKSLSYSDLAESHVFFGFEAKKFRVLKQNIRETEKELEALGWKVLEKETRGMIKDFRNIAIAFLFTKKVDALLKAVKKCATEWGPLWICWHSPGIHNPLCFFSPLMAERHKNLWGTDPVEEIERYTQKLPEQISSNSYLLDCFWENRESLLHYITFSVELFGITEIFYIYRERLFQNFDEEFFRPLLRATESKQYLDTIAAMRYKNSDTYDEKKVLDTLEGLVDLSYRQLTYNIPCSNNFTILPCFEKQKTSMQIQPTWGWLPTLWAKVLAAIVHDRKIFVCDFCGEIYTREVMPRQGHKRRCPKCRFAK